MGKKLNQKQKEAVEYLEGPLLVLAGPGTGKTQLLSEKIAYILKNTDTLPENILAVTFTEAGAQNMRRRLEQVIGVEAEKINIGTYHAFGADILRQYKNHNPKYQRLLDENVGEVAQFQIIKEIKENLPALDPLRANSVGEILGVISRAKAARLTSEELEIIAEVNKRDSLEIKEKIQGLMAKLVPRMKLDLALEEVYQPLLDILTQYNGAIVKGIKKEAELFAKELAKAIEKAKAGEKPSIQPLTKWKKENLALDRTGRYELKNVVANMKLASIAEVMGEYNKVLEKNGWYDFNDMIEEAILAMRDDEGFRLTLSENYQFILLDEFQDTNPSQFEIIKLLTAYEKPIVMAVGDDDQAIFAFQGASASNLVDFKEHYGAKIITLKQNYRSTKEILEFSRKIADQIDDSFAKTQGEDKNLTAERDAEILGGETEPKTSRYEFLTSDDEYSFVAKRIKELVDEGEDPREIAVITPKHKGIAPIIPYLKAENLAVAYEKRENILEEERIMEIVQLCRLVNEIATGKDSSHLLVGVMMANFWEISPVEVLKAVEAARLEHKNLYLSILENSDEKFVRFKEVVAELVKIATLAPLELFLDKLTGVTEVKEGLKSPFLEFYGGKEDFSTFDLYNKLAVLRAKMREYLPKEGLRLADFISFVDDYNEAQVQILNTSPYQDSERSVQVMTAHKSKGLEFKYVFLVNVDNLRWGKSGGNKDKLVLPKNLSQIKPVGKTANEQLRLLFVAITRAKYALVMTNSVKDFAGKIPKRLEYLNEWEDEKGEVQSEFLAKKKVEKIEIAGEKKTDLRYFWLERFIGEEPDLRQILLKKQENYRLSASDLKSFVDLKYAGPMSFFESRIMGLPREPESVSIILGNLLHLVFEKIVNADIELEEAKKILADELSKKELEEKDEKYILDKGAAAIEASLQEFKELFLIKNQDETELKLKAEVDFYRSNVSYKGVRITGKIDLIKIDKNNKEIEVYDYKTGKYSDKGWGSEWSLMGHALQLEFYKLLVENSLEFKGYKVEKGAILFVSPDEKGEVFKKDYKFDLFKNGEFEQLVEAVYGQVKSLEFLDREELRLYKNKEAGLKEIKEFIKMLIEEKVNL